MEIAVSRHSASLILSFHSQFFRVAPAQTIFSAKCESEKMLSSSLMVCGSEDGLPHISLHVFVKAAIKAATSCQPEKEGILPAGLGNDRTQPRHNLGYQGILVYPIFLII